jgi:hypothetical protein
MDKHIVFLLHGVGKQQKDWADEPIKIIKDHSDKTIAKFALQTQYDVEFHDLFYSDLLDKNIEQMLAGGDSLFGVNKFLKQGFEERNNPNYVAKTNSEKVAAGLRDFGLDVLCYTLNPNFMTLILNDIATQLVSKISLNSGAKFSLVTHSLGTKVGFDLLHQLYLKEYSVTPAGLPMAGSPAFLSYYHLASVAEVIGLFDFASYTPNNSHVKVINRYRNPEQLGVISKSYRIFNNQFDPVALIGMANKIDANVYSEYKWLNYIDQVWMHDLTCYLNNPSVHLSMIEDFYGVQIPDLERQHIIDTYDKSDKNLKDEFKTLYSQIKGIIDAPTDLNNINDFIKNLTTIIDQIKNIH